MGCVQSQDDIHDSHPNIFRVVNVDEGGVPSGSGQLEVTETELILHRKNKEPTIWPLKSLRRYGFDADLFSFESGRRCDTGQGIYAFKCRRAEALYHSLQTFIQVRNTSSEEHHGTTEYPMPSSTNGPAVAARNFRMQGNIRISNSSIVDNGENLQLGNIANGLNEDGNYLDPLPLVRHFNQRLDDVPMIGSLSPEALSPGSPISNNILEVTTLNPLPSSNSHSVSNVYQTHDFSQRESNNNKKFAFLHSYTNSCTAAEIPEMSTNAILATNAIDSTNTNSKNIVNKLLSPLENKANSLSTQAAYMNIEPTSCSLSEIDPEVGHLYMNITTNEMHQNKLPIISNLLKGSANNKPQMQRINLPSPGVSLMMEDKHCYENLDLTDMKLDIHQSPIKKNSCCMSVPQTPTIGTREVNYIELDLENVKPEIQSGQCSSTQNLLPPESPRKPAGGYATIDFNKTVALSNSATPCLELDSEGSRKTRHNSTVTLGRNSNSISD